MLAIAFEGCACRSAFYAGVAVALAEAKLPIRLAAGSSSGSIAAVAVAAGLGAELPRMWDDIAGRSIVSLKRLLWNRSPFDMSYLLRSTIERHLLGKDLRPLAVEALVVATKLRPFERVVFSSREEASMIEPVLGSCFLPVFYGRPIRVGRRLVVDGGVLDNLPVELLAERGADEIIAVLPSEHGVSFKDLRRRRWRPAMHNAKLHVIHPTRPLQLGSWDLDRERVARAIDEGFVAGRRFTR